MTDSQPIVASWSGGKDSTLMLEALLADPRRRVVSLLTTVTAGYDRISIHGVRRAILDAQADALRLPVEVAEIPRQASNASYESAFAGRAYDEDLLRDLPESVDPCGENGEFHTCLVGGPLLGRSIPVEHGERVLRDGRFQYCDLVPE